jgi:diguanylate cyclase (GGDEF)-like protein
LNAMDGQLQQYAQDFQLLVAMHHDLEQRYENLSAASQQLAGGDEVLRSMAARTRERCIVTNRLGHIVQATDAARAFIERSGAPMKSLQGLVSPFHLPRLRSLLGCTQEVRNAMASDEAEVLLNLKAGDASGPIYVATLLPLDSSDTAKVYWVISELNQKEQAEIVRGRNRGAGDGLRSGLAMFNLAGELIATDRGFVALLGAGASQDKRQTLSTFLVKDAPIGAGSTHLLAGLTDKGHWYGEILSLAGRSMDVRQWMSVSAIKNALGQTVSYIAMLDDMEKMLVAERALLHAQCHDTLTGLANRQYFEEQASSRMGNSSHALQHAALLTITLDRCGGAEDTGDCEVSEAVIVKLGERLQALSRGCDLLAHPQPNRFQILLAGQGDDVEYGQIAARLVRALSEPVTVGQHDVHIDALVGCALYPSDGADLTALNLAAERAMLPAQEAGLHLYALFHRQVAPLRARRAVAAVNGHTARQGDAFNPSSRRLELER